MPGGRRWGRVLRRWAVVLVLLALVLSAVGYLWYRQQAPDVQQRVEMVVLDGLDLVRDRPGIPHEVQRALDWVADQVPVSQAGVISLPAGTTVLGEEVLMGVVGPRELVVLENVGYAVGWDPQRRNPAWARYRVGGCQGKTVERPDRFLTDERVPRPVTHDDYTGSGYDRGHLAPNATIGRCYGAQAQRETFLLTNIVPQRPELNRDRWRLLEARVRERLAPRLEEVWVITGPLYGEDPAYLRSGVMIPSAYYKVVVDRVGADGVRVMALVLPQEGPEPLLWRRYLVSLDEIEAATGLDFFAAMPASWQHEVEAAPALRIW